MRVSDAVRAARGDALAARADVRAACRINDSTCGVSPGIAQRIVYEESRS